MVQRNKVIEIYGLWVIDIAGIALMYMFATYLRFGNFRDMGNKETHFMTCVILMLASTVYSFFLDWNRDFMKRGAAAEAAAILRHMVFILVLSIVALYLIYSQYDVSRLTLAIFAVLDALFCFLAHMLFKRAVRSYYRMDAAAAKVIVVSEKDEIRETVRRLRDQLEVAYDIVGACAVDADLRGEEIEGVKVVADRDTLVSEATQMTFDEVFFYTPSLSQRQLEDLIGAFDEMGVVSHYALESANPKLRYTSSRVGTFGDYSVVTYTRFKSSYKRLLLKRVIDIIGGITGLAITAVLTPFIALAIKADSRGPVFFSQVRVGRNGRRFRIHKFRSMVANAEEKLDELKDENEMKGLMFKMEDDPRVTKVGAFLRKTSLDELPQFLNILKGEMSLVGTRPPTEEEFEQYNEHYRRRLSMTPGLTGLWQVSGRSDIESFDEVVKLDLRYIDEWSLTLDWKILFKTVGVVLGRRGAR